MPGSPERIAAVEGLIERVPTDRPQPKGFAHDLVGRVFGRLTVLRRSGRAKHGSIIWLCRCQCGVEKNIIAGNLTAGTTVSCGCMHREALANRNRTHGETPKGSRSSEYMVWQTMIRRCTNKSDPNYHNYGGRGIAVCNRWMFSFESFLEDMGRKPSKNHSLDRINNDGGYDPRNCRWATAVQQGENRRTSISITRSDGLKFPTIVAASRSVGANPSSISEAVRVGRLSFGYYWKRADNVDL